MSMTIYFVLGVTAEMELLFPPTCGIDKRLTAKANVFVGLSVGKATWLFHASYLKYNFLDTCYPLGIRNVFVHAQKSLGKSQCSSVRRQNKERH